MTKKTKIRKIGNSYGIILPKETLQQLNVEENSVVYLTETAGSTLNLSSQEPSFDEMMKFADEGMEQYNHTLTELAK